MSLPDLPIVGRHPFFVAFDEMMKPDRTEYVYFAKSLLGGDLIKIGTTTDIDKRMRALHATCLARYPGGRDEERRLHRRFAHLREVGEWFKPCQELHVLIGEHALPTMSPERMAEARAAIQALRATPRRRVSRQVRRSPSWRA